MTNLLTRRSFALLWPAAFGIGQSPRPPAIDAELRSEFLLDLLITAQQPNAVSANRLIVPVSGGTFDGPKLKGSVLGPSADWIEQRADGSRLLDVRLVLQTDDGAKVYMNWRGIGYTPSGGTLYARILPMFETGAAKYAWLNDIVAVGVYRPTPGQIAYRVYQIL